MTPAGIEPATFRFVAQHLNHCATAVKVGGSLNNASEFDEFGVDKNEFYKFRFILTLEYTRVNSLKGINCNGNVFCLVSV